MANAEKDNILKRIAAKKAILIDEETQKDAQRLQEEIDEAQRVKDLESDPRYLEIMSIANSPILKQALEIYSEEFGKSPVGYDNPKTYEVNFSHSGKRGLENNRPIGDANVRIHMGFETSNYDGDTLYTEEWLELCITWLDKDEKSEQYRMGGGRNSSIGTRGLDAKAGLVILWGARHSYGPSTKIFTSFEEVIDHITEQIARRQVLQGRRSD